MRLFYHIDKTELSKMLRIECMKYKQQLKITYLVGTTISIGIDPKHFFQACSQYHSGNASFFCRRIFFLRKLKHE